MNANDYSAGTYTYPQTGPNRANDERGHRDDERAGTTNVTTVNLTFTSATAANYAWTNENGSGQGTMKFSKVKNLVPASVAGQTAHITVKGNLVTDVGFDSDGTFKSIRGSQFHHLHQLGDLHIHPIQSDSGHLEPN